MPELTEKIAKINWQDIADQLHDKGYAVVPDFLSQDQCQQLIAGYDKEAGYRKTVVMERYRFGLGTYKYYDYPLPPLIQSLREAIYPRLVPIANLWMNALKLDKKFPEDFQQLQSDCQKHQQNEPTPLILKYDKGGYNTLHQDLYGDVYFPLQAAIQLSQSNVDYTGGEFILTQQVPRTQSKAIVLTPPQGSMIIFTTNFRPVKGAKGYYRANMRHGVSELHSGTRYALGLIFHDAGS